VAKQSGLGDNFFLGGWNLSGDTNSLGEVGGGPASLDTTGIDKSANERIGGLRDGRIEWTSYFNPEEGQAHEALSTLPTADRHLMYLRGVGLGNQAACLVAKQLNYDPTRADDGALSIAVRAEANGFGLEWGVQLTAGIQTDTGADDGTGVDTVASADFGAQAYLQVFAFDGTDVTVKIQDSADDATYADVTGLEFAEITTDTKGGQRIAIANTETVRQYVRAVTVTTGGFTELQYAVVLVKNEIEGQVF
jgi:hypothetical protein